MRPAVIVTPDRDVPGTRASACAQPITRASLIRTWVMSRSRRPNRSASAMRTAYPESVKTMTVGLRRLVSIHPANSNPATAAGTVPIPMASAIRASSVSRWPVTNCTPPRSRPAISPRKKMQTAINDPKCTATSNARPWSTHSKNAGTRTRCPELEIGKNSVNPWTMASTTTCTQLTVASFWPCQSS